MMMHQCVRGVFVWAVFVGAMTGIASPLLAETFGFEDIGLWVGDGPNHAAMVIDWGDEQVAWGYRWSGSATSQDMLLAIAGQTRIHIAGDSDQFNPGDAGQFVTSHTGAAPRLFVRLSQFDFGFPANAIFGLGYDLDNDGGTFTTGFEGLDPDFSTDPSRETGSADDPDDLYHEGWFQNPSWRGSRTNISASGGPYAGGSWDKSTFLGNPLNNGDWDGWSIGGGTVPVGLPTAAVPEPGTAALLSVIGVGLWRIRHRRCNSIAHNDN